MRFPTVLRPWSNDDVPVKTKRKRGQSNQAPPLLFGSATVEFQAAESRQPTVTITAYTGGVMTVAGVGSVVIDTTGIDSKDQIPLLADHDANLRGIVGHGSVTVNGGEVIVTGQILTTTDAAKSIVQLSKDGFLFQASVGLLPTQRKKIPAGTSVTVNGRTITAPQGGLTLIQAGRLREVSITALGADSETTVDIAAKAKDRIMPDHNDQTSTTDTTNTDVLQFTAEGTVNDIRNQAAEESKRIADIRAACGGDFPTIEAAAISEGWTATRAEVEVLRASRGSGPAIHSHSRSPGGPNVLEAALLTRAGKESLAEKELGAQTMEQANHLRAASMVDLARTALQMDGQPVSANRDEMLRASFASSTYSLPVALGNAMNKSLLAAYLEAPATWRAFAATRPAADFKTHTSIRPSATGQLEQVAPDGAIKSGSLSETTYPWNVDTYAKKISVTRTHLVNDDTGFLDETAPALGRMAARAVADKVYTVLLGAGSFFSSGNANYDEGSTSALDIDSLSLGVQRIRQQRDGENNDLDIEAKTLLVPPELESLARSLLESEFIERAEDKATGNPFRGKLSMAVEPRLSNTVKFTSASALAWYVWASPSDAGIIVGFLNGRQTPTIEFFGLDHDPQHLGVAWRVYFDYGCALADPRAAYKAKGEA